jgi:hypothetical protein
MTINLATRRQALQRISASIEQVTHIMSELQKLKSDIEHFASEVASFDELYDEVCYLLNR